MPDQQILANPLLTGGRWKGRMPIGSVIPGGFLGYVLSKRFIIAPLAAEARAGGKSLSWDGAAMYAAFGTLAGVVAIGLLIMIFEQFVEWLRYRRQAQFRQQDFINQFAHPEKNDDYH